MKSNFGGNFSFLCFAKSEILQILLSRILLYFRMLVCHEMTCSGIHLHSNQLLILHSQIKYAKPKIKPWSW